MGWKMNTWDVGGGGGGGQGGKCSWRLFREEEF